MVREFIKKHPALVIKIIVIAIIVVFILGIIIFLLTMPGLVLGKLDEWGRNLLGNIAGMVTGDSTTAKISKEDVLGLAQYLQQMGYDIQGYGLGNVKYKDDGKTTNQRNGATKEIESITKSVDGKEYLLAYIAANENTYVLSQNSVLGEIKSSINNLFNWNNEEAQTTAKEYSTGMINILANYNKNVAIDRDSQQMRVYTHAIELPSWSGIGIITRIIKGDTKIQFGDYYSYDLNNWVGKYGRPTELFLALHLSTMMPDLTHQMATSQEFNTKVNMGMVDLNVSYETTATKGDSTLSEEEILDMYDKYCKDITTVTNTETGGGERLEINDSDEFIPGTEWTYGEIVELQKVAKNGFNSSSTGETQIEEWGKLGDAPIQFSSVSEDDGHFTKYKELTDEQVRDIAKVCCREQGNEDMAGIAAEASLIANIYENLRNGDSVYSGGVYRKASFYEFVRDDGWFGGMNASTMDSPTGYSSNPVNDQAVEIVKQVLVNGKRTLPIYIDEHDCLEKDIDYIKNNGEKVDKNNKDNYIRDVTILHQDPNRIIGGGEWIFYDFPSETSDPFGYHEKYGGEFHYIFDQSSESSSNGGSKGKMKWPFIASITNHWYYNDIGFTKTVYRFAKAATKTINYIPEDEENILNKNNVSVKLDATLTSSMGVIYQVAEPEATGPNERIKKLFDQEYYKYDGTVDTAKMISNAKAADLNKSTYDFNGEKYNTEKSEVQKEKVSFKSNKATSLSAFGMLQNMHTEAADHIYRNLKDLMVKLDYFSEEELNEDAKEIMLWPVQTDNKDETWEIVKDQNNFGTIIKCRANEKTIIAPSDAIIKSTQEGAITLEFTTINDEAIELLEYIFKQKDPYKKINKDLLTGIEMTIKGIEVDSALTQDGTVKRGQLLGTAIGDVDGNPAISITMYNLDKSLIENINEYLRQEENTKYEAIMNAKKLMGESYTESGLDISSLLKQGGNRNSSASASLAMLTQTLISREEFIEKCQAYQNTWGGKFAEVAGDVYDICVSNGINPVIAAAQGYCEQHWIPSDTGNFWGLGVWNDMDHSVLGSHDVKWYAQAYCDNLNDRINSEHNGDKLGALAESKILSSYSGNFTGKMTTMYDIYSNYAAIGDADANPAGQAKYVTEYVNLLIEVSKNIFGDDVFGASEASYNGENAPANVREFVNKALSAEGSAYVYSGYVWTGNPATSQFTCSGLVDFALGNPPRTNSPESLMATVKSKGNFRENLEDLKYGDLLFFTYAGRYPGHVGIYLGDHLEIHAGGSDDGGMMVCKHTFPMDSFMGGGSIF